MHVTAALKKQTFFPSLHTTVKLVNKVVGAFKFKCSFEVLDGLRCVVECIPEILRNVLVFKIGFSIEVFCLYKADAFFFCALHNDHISGEEIILLDHDKITDFDVTPS